MKQFPFSPFFSAVLLVLFQKVLEIADATKEFSVNLQMSTESPSSVFIYRQDPQTLPMSSPRSRVKKSENEAYQFMKPFSYHL